MTRQQIETILEKHGLNPLQLISWTPEKIVLTDYVTVIGVDNAIEMDETIENNKSALMGWLGY